MNAEGSAGLVRSWVSLYTRGLPAEVRQNRRDEIDDDLWCQAQDARESDRDDRSLANEVIARLVLGIRADLSWRAEQSRLAGRQAQRRRDITVRAPVAGLLAVIGGIGWAVWPIPQGIVGTTWPEGNPLSLVLFLSVIGGTFALAGAVAGFLTTAADRMRTWVVVIGRSAQSSASSECWLSLRPSFSSRSARHCSSGSSGGSDSWEHGRPSPMSAPPSSCSRSSW